jgi:DNA-binding NarL/FixJ family response regulator
MGEKTFDGAVVAAHKRGATIQLINDNGVTISVISPSSNDADDARRRVVAGEVWLDPLQEQKEYQLPNLTHPDGKPRPGRAGLPDEARKKILSLLKRGVKTSEISRAVGVCRSTVNRMQASAVISEKPTALPTDPKDNLISESLNF